MSLQIGEHHAKLEAHVLARTSELNEANATLLSEISERQDAEAARPMAEQADRMVHIFQHVRMFARDALEDRMAADEAFTDAQVALMTGATEKSVHIKVQDNGGGITEDILAKIFDPFFTTKDPDKGTGLGMSICLSIVEDFGGKLQVDSTPGIGTTVRIDLPIQKTDPS
jgi:C4-dicarboxylate-specific signal transduction histidine kinase